MDQKHQRGNQHGPENARVVEELQSAHNATPVMHPRHPQHAAGVAHARAAQVQC